MNKNKTSTKTILLTTTIIMILLANIVMVSSEQAKNFDLTKIDPQVQQMIMGGLMGQEFDLEKILTQVLISEVGQMSITGTCMTYGDILKLFPQGKCGSTDAGKLYAAHELILLNTCNGCMGVVRAEYSTCVSAAQTTYTTRISTCVSSGVLAPTCEVTWGPEYTADLAICETKKTTGFKACATTYQTGSQKAAKLANNLRLGALAYGASQGSFEGFPCDEILGSCIPSTMKFADYGSMYVCKDYPGMLNKFLQDPDISENFFDRVNKGFNKDRFNQIVEMGDKITSQITPNLEISTINHMKPEDLARIAPHLSDAQLKDKNLAGKNFNKDARKALGDKFSEMNSDAFTNSKLAHPTETITKPDTSKAKLPKGKDGKPLEKPEKKDPGEKITSKVQETLRTYLPHYMQMQQQMQAQQQQQAPRETPPKAFTYPPCDLDCPIPPGGKTDSKGCYYECYQSSPQLELAQQAIEDTESNVEPPETAAVVLDTEHEKLISIDSSEYDEKGLKYCHYNGACLYTKNFYKNEIDFIQFYNAGATTKQTIEPGKGQNMFVVKGENNNDLENLDKTTYHIDKDGTTEMFITHEDGAIIEDENYNYIWLDTGITSYSQDKYVTNTNFMHMNSGITLKPQLIENTNQMTTMAVNSLQPQDIEIKLNDPVPLTDKGVSIFDANSKIIIRIKDTNTNIDINGDKGILPIEIRDNKAYGSRDIVGFVHTRLYKDYDLHTLDTVYQIKPDHISTKIIDKNNKVIQNTGTFEITTHSFNDYQKMMMKVLEES